jgi:NAD(P)-dependent dehydrogenase (short-subunit alcohol dehydrogenase family)
VPTALISGASTGIGRATALMLARERWTVLAGVRDPKAGERLSADSRGSDLGGSLIPLTLDITDAGEVTQAVEVVSEHVDGGALDALVNNAGIGLSGPLELIPIDDLRRQFEVNLFGHVALTQALLPALRLGRGRIVFVSSIGGRIVVPFSAPYGASKHALEAVGDSLRVELRSSGIQVTLVEPGSVATPIWDKSRLESERIVVPATLQGEYGRVAGAMDRVIERTGRRGMPADRVASTIVKALCAKRMRSRYLVGADARGMVLARALLPDVAFDWVMRRGLGV